MSHFLARVSAILFYAISWIKLQLQIQLELLSRLGRSARQQLTTLRARLERSPHVVLLLFPFLGMPIKLRALEPQGIKATLKAAFPLLGVASTACAGAYIQFQDFYLGLVESNFVATRGQAYFDELKFYLAGFACLVPVLALFAIAIAAAIQTLLHRAMLAITHLDIRAESHLGFRFHLIQCASTAMYVGAFLSAIGLIAKNWSFLETPVRTFLKSDLGMLVVTVIVLARFMIYRRRQKIAEEAFGTRLRQFIASSISLALGFSALALVARLL